MSNRVINYIKIIADNEGETYITRYVWEYNYLRIRDRNSDLIELPSQFTYRSLYMQYYWEMGWKAKATMHGNFSLTSKYEI